MTLLLNACPLTSPNGCAFGRSEDVLRLILKDETNVALWKRSVRRELLDWGATLKWCHVDPFEVEILDGELDAFSGRLTDEVERWSTVSPQLNRWVIADMRSTVSLYMSVTGARRVGVRIAPVDTDMCRLFHVDHNLLRLLCTYVGEGTQWLANDNVRRENLGNPAGLNDKIVIDSKRIYQADTLDVLVLKGGRWPFIPRGGAVHRSPPLSPGEKRLLLRVDYLK
jgi:hypothetical protein